MTRIEQQLDDVSVFSTGGSFEKVYSTGAGARDLVFGKISAAEEMARRLGLSGVDVESPMQIAVDSLDMTHEHRSVIVAWCKAEPCNCLVIIHGTDTMVQTARYLASFELPKTIVLTGSLQPACMKGSDAESNFVSSVLASRLMGSGVWICMHGKLFPHDMCCKNPVTGYFVETLPREHITPVG